MFIFTINYNFFQIAKQMARERMIEYEKHLLETDLEKSHFNDSFNKYTYNLV